MFDVLVLGAGINGLSIAWELSQYPSLKIGLLERFTVGNLRGSSHGHTRITRLSYANPKYIAPMRLLHEELWPAWEKTFGKSFLQKREGCFFGDGIFFEKFLQAITEHQLPIEILTKLQAQRVYPQFAFAAVETVVRDYTGGILAAGDLMEQLKTGIRTSSVDFQEQTRVLQIDRGGKEIAVHTDRGVMKAKKLVVAAGPWTGSLLPECRFVLTPIRQTISYFSAPADQFPFWAYYGDEALFYGLPELKWNRVKAVEHQAHGKIDDPEDVSLQPNLVQLQRLQAFLAKQFIPSYTIEAQETCMYTCTSTEDFFIGPLPQEERILLCAACSGHAFKFAPLTGKIVAALALGRNPPYQEIYKNAYRLPVELIGKNS